MEEIYMKMLHVTIQTKHFEEEMKFFMEHVGLDIVNDMRPFGRNMIFLANGEGETNIEIIENMEADASGNRYLSVGFKTEDVEMTLRFIFGFAMLYPIIGSFGIFISKEDRAFGFVNLISLILCVIMLVSTGMSFSGGFSSGSSGKKCAFCEKRTRTHGIYCSECYEATH